MNRKMVNFVIDSEVWEKFKKIAQDKGLSASAMLRNYIVSKVEREMRNERTDMRGKNEKK